MSGGQFSVIWFIACLIGLLFGLSINETPCEQVVTAEEMLRIIEMERAK